MSLLVVSTVIGMTTPVFAGLDDAIEDGVYKGPPKIVLKAANRAVKEDRLSNPDGEKIFNAGMKDKYTIKASATVLDRSRYAPYPEPIITFSEITENDDGGWKIKASIKERYVSLEADMTISGQVLSDFGIIYLRYERGVLERRNPTMPSHYIPGKPEWMQ